MSDEKRRAAERQAESEGGTEAAETAAKLENRVGRGPYSSMVERWVLITGVRNHYRGKLLSFGSDGLAMRLYVHPLIEIDSYYGGEPDSPTGVLKDGGIRETSLEAPGIILEAGILDVTLQPKSWPKRAQTKSELPGDGN